MVFQSLMKTHIPPNPTNKLLLAALAALALAVPSTSLLAQDQGSTNASTNSQAGPNRPPDESRLLPPHAQDALKLTDAQKQQVKDLETEVKTKLEAILTADQLKQLKEMREHRPPGGGPREEGPDGGNPPPPPAD